MSIIASLGQNSWPGSKILAQKKSDKPVGFSAILDNERQKNHAPDKTSMVRLGTIGPDNPTVSHLMIKNPRYSRDCWAIIHNSANQDKDFTKMKPGTMVWLDKDSLEICWGAEYENSAHGGDLARPLIPISQSVDSNNFSARLVHGVSQFLGMRYSEVDCYELVVKGLSSMGVRYGGDNGLKQVLMNMAVADGKASNAYLTGEGLLSVCGIRNYKKTFDKITSPQTMAKQAFKQIRPLLEPGSILSLSTKTRGHTGVVGLQDNTWTYINSGRMDHDLAGHAIAKGVGEEDLAAELKNWFSLAKKRNESLTITFGTLAEDRLDDFVKKPTDGLNFIG